MGVRLVREGLATVTPFDPELEARSVYRRYYRGLLKAEDRALRRGLGRWKSQEEAGGLMGRIKKRLFGQ